MSPAPPPQSGGLSPWRGGIVGRCEQQVWKT